MATGVLGAIGKFASGVAQVGVPMVLEQQKAEVMAKRDAVLQGYAEQSATRQEDFTAGQNQLTRDQSASQHNQEMALKAGELSIQQQTALKNSNLADAQIQQSQAAVKEINQKLAVGDFTLDQQKQLAEVRNMILTAKTEEDAKKASLLYERLNLKDKGDRFSFGSAPSGETDASGNPIREAYSGNTETGDVKWLKPPSADGTKSAAAPGSRTIQGPSGRMFAPAEVDDAVSQVMADPSPENMAGFRAHFGNDLADQHFKAIQSAQSSAAPAPTAASSTSVPTPASGAINAAQQSPDPLVGFSTDEGERPGMKLIKSVTGSISKARDEKIAPAENQASQVAAQAVQSVIASKNLVDLARLRATGELQKALNSGMLSSQESAVVNAWLARQK